MAVCDKPYGTRHDKEGYGVLTMDEDGATFENRGSGQIVHTVVGMDKPFFTALAVALSVFSTIYAFEAGRQTAQAVYWLQRSEAFLEQLSAQGVHVPPDLLQHKERHT